MTVTHMTPGTGNSLLDGTGGDKRGGVWEEV